MVLSVYLSLALCLCVGLAGTSFAGRLSPATAARMLAAGAVCAAGCWVVDLALLAFALFARLRPVAREGHWSAAALAARSPVPEPIALSAGTLLVLALVVMAVSLARCLGHVRALYRFGGGAPAAADEELLIVRDSHPRALALPGLPGRRGRIVLSTGMCEAIGPAERRALLAHERSHLRGRHHLYRGAVAFAAAACPALWLLIGPIDYALERWADEDAASAVGSRRLVARALGAAALATLGVPVPSSVGLRALGSRGEQVPRRIRALLSAGRPSTQGAALWIFAAPVALAVLASIDASGDLADLLRIAVQALGGYSH